MLFLRWTHRLPLPHKSTQSVGFSWPNKQCLSPFPVLHRFSFPHNIHQHWKYCKSVCLLANHVCSSVEQKFQEELFYWSIISNQCRLCVEGTNECIGEWKNPLLPTVLLNSAWICLCQVCGINYCYLVNFLILSLSITIALFLCMFSLLAMHNA